MLCVRGKAYFLSQGLTKRLNCQTFCVMAVLSYVWNVSVSTPIKQNGGSFEDIAAVQVLAVLY